MNRYKIHQHRPGLDFEIRVGDRIRLSSVGFDYLKKQGDSHLARPIEWYINNKGTVMDIDKYYYGKNPYNVKWDGWECKSSNVWPLEFIEKIFHE